MPHRPWHTGNPFFGGGMYGGEEEFDLPALFAASPQLGNLSPLLGGISGGMMDMPVPPVERPFLGGMGGGLDPMDMNVPIGPEPPPSAPMLTPEQMREIGLRSALQKTGLGSVPFDPMWTDGSGYDFWGWMDESC